jgi:hypothetical protein
MTTIEWNRATPIALTDLPEVVTSYLAAHRARDIDAELTFYIETSRVTDEGHTHTGPAEIRTWLESAASEYTFTIEITAASTVDSLHYDVLQHLEGNFPGGVADLHFRFGLLNDATIADLTIEV